MRRKRRRFYFIPFVIIAVVALVSAVVMLLWNEVVVEVFGLRRISYWQAACLFILCKILFGSFRPGPRMPFRGHHWREKLMNMSEEEREAMKAEWRKRVFRNDRNGPSA